MPHPELPPSKDAVKYAKSSWSFVAGLLGPVVTIVNFIKLWQGDQSTINYVIICLGIVAFLFFLAWIGFKKRGDKQTTGSSSAQTLNLAFLEGTSPESAEPQLLPPHLPESNKPSSAPQPLYPRFYRWARLGLAVFILAGITAGVLLIHQQKALDSKVIILVTELSGPDPENYRVTEELITTLQTALAGYDNALIVTVPQAVTAQQGSDMARKLGKDRTADIVLWGWYGITDSDVRLTLNIENLNERQFEELGLGNTLQAQSSAAEMNSFSFQQNLGKEISAFTYYLQGLVAFESNDLNKALALFTKAAASPEWNDELVKKSHVLLNRSMVYVALKQYDNALADLNSVLHLDKEMHFPLFERGFVYYEMGSWQECVADFSNYLKFMPDSTGAYINRGLCEYSLGQYDQAIADYSKSIKIDPTVDNAYNNLSLVYQQQELYAQAMDAARKGVFYAPFSTVNQRTLAESYHLAKHYYLALFHFTVAVWLDPSLPYALSDRGSVWMDMGKYDLAVADETKAIQMDPTNARFFTYRGLSESYQMKYTDAIDDLNQAVSLEPASAIDLYIRGLIYSYMGETDHAVADFDKALTLTKDAELISMIQEQMSETDSSK